MSDELFQTIKNKGRYEEVEEILEKHPEAVKVKDTNGNFATPSCTTQ
jgi:hypothetical protein